MDKRDKISIWISGVGIFTIVIILYFLPKEHDNLVNQISIIGSIASTAGAAVAILQILKIKTNNDTFLRTLKVIENNSLIDIISRSIEQVRLIKEYFDMEKAPQSRSNFNILRNEVNEVSFNVKAEKYKAQLIEFVTFCSLTETQLYDGTLDNSRAGLSEKYSKLTELESLLQEIKAISKRPDQENI